MKQTRIDRPKKAKPDRRPRSTETRRDFTGVLTRTPLPDIPQVPGAGAADDESYAPGLSAAIGRLRAAEVRAAKTLDQATAMGNVALIAHCRKAWIELCEQLRRIEESNPDIRRANDETAPIVEMQDEIHRLCRLARRALESMPRTLTPRLLGQDETGIMRILTEGVDEVCAHLHSGKWYHDP